MKAIMEKMKKYETENSILTDVINEIENKLKVDDTIIQNEKEVNDMFKESEKKIAEYGFSSYNRFQKEEEEECPRMTERFLDRLLCTNHKLYYRTYDLNDCLYLHFKGFKQIENLHHFVNLKVLYLEGNCIRKIDGLNHLKHLMSLYLHENMIEKIENLEGLDELYNLNLSDNQIAKVENLACLPKLSNLLIKRNKIGINGDDDLEGLAGLPITVLDISDNKIEMSDVLKHLEKVPKLRVLYLFGNECVRKIANYRKNMINNLTHLTYLDDKPVFEDERRFSEAFARGGLEEERRERALYKKEKLEAEYKRLADFNDQVRQWQGESKREETPIYEVNEKEKEDQRKKLLEKCKKKVVKPENEIFDDNDMPDLETVKTKKEEGFIEYMIDKTLEPEITEIEKPSKINIIEEEINTDNLTESTNVKKLNTFDELD
jgi:hypothetical protein